jgi:hypothetical protein
MIALVREFIRHVETEADGGLKHLRANVFDLADALRAHNHREEELLRGMTANGGLDHSDAESVNRRHFDEHEALHTAMVEVSLDPDVRRSAGRLAASLDTILEHMAIEESTFLRGFPLDSEADTDPYGARVLQP